MRPAAALLVLALVLFSLAPVVPLKLQQAPPHSQTVPRKFIVQFLSDGSGSSMSPSRATAGGAQLDGVEPTATESSSHVHFLDKNAAAEGMHEITRFDSDIFKGMVVSAATDEAAAMLLKKLTQDDRVASIFPVVSMQRLSLGSTVYSKQPESHQLDSDHGQP